MAVVLTGNEIISVLGIAQNGFPAAYTEPTTLGAAVQLASSQGNAVAIATPDVGTTQTLTAPMVTTTPNASTVIHVSAGGATPSLTMPLATAIIAALPGFAIGDSYVLRFINTNSGTATIVTNTGITTSGTLTLATNTTRDFAIVMTGAAALSMTSIGTGTTS